MMVIEISIISPCTSCQNEHGDPHFLLLFYHLLGLLHQCTKFHQQSMLGSFTKESP